MQRAGAFANIIDYTPRWTRAVGTLCAAICFQYRVVHWPERFGYAGKPVAVFLIFVSACLDVLYPFVFRAVQKREQAVDGIRMSQTSGKAK